MKETKITQFIPECGGYSHGYSTVTCCANPEAAKLSLPQIKAALQKFADYTKESAERLFYNGIYKENDGTFSVEAYRVTPDEIASFLSGQFPDNPVYADWHWDGDIFCAYLHGTSYGGYTAEFEEGFPREYEEYEEDTPDSERYYDCNVIVTDTMSGEQMYIGGGMCDAEGKNMYESIVQEHSIIKPERK